MFASAFTTVHAHFLNVSDKHLWYPRWHPRWCIPQTLSATTGGASVWSLREGKRVYATTAAMSVMAWLRKPMNTISGRPRVYVFSHIIIHRAATMHSAAWYAVGVLSMPVIAVMWLRTPEIGASQLPLSESDLALPSMLLLMYSGTSGSTAEEAFIIQNGYQFPPWSVSCPNSCWVNSQCVKCFRKPHGWRPMHSLSNTDGLKGMC